jgi:AmmeMemoRadiSam system protein B
VGLIAPHLDYPRGMPCYASAYASLGAAEPPSRFVILGTNHFGVGNRAGVVATSHDFATPLGTVRTDRAFLDRLEARCGDLRRYEYDHAGEHSIELQVCWLQHLFGTDAFTIVPFLFSDPCGPTGTAPVDGQGVDLADFADALREAVGSDDQSTVIIAAADFSHVGMFFGDQRQVDDTFLSEVRARDEDILQVVEQGDASAFRECVARNENPTRVCSAGCMYVLLAALPGARATVLRYHQAVVESAQNCVTCAAVVLRM